MSLKARTVPHEDASFFEGFAGSLAQFVLIPDSPLGMS